MMTIFFSMVVDSLNVPGLSTRRGAFDVPVRVPSAGSDPELGFIPNEQRFLYPVRYQNCSSHDDDDDDYALLHQAVATNPGSAGRGNSARRSTAVRSFGRCVGPFCRSRP